MRVVTIDEETGKRVYSRKEVANIVGVSTQTIRLWEEAGSIPAPSRDENDYRYWVEDDIERIKEYAGLPRKEKLKK
nr:MerR family DNA-binding transcriptional regulator [uncultured Clostridium sp.]